MKLCELNFGSESNPFVKVKIKGISNIFKPILNDAIIILIYGVGLGLANRVDWVAIEST